MFGLNSLNLDFMYELLMEYTKVKSKNYNLFMGALEPGFMSKPDKVWTESKFMCIRPSIIELT